MKSFSHFSLFIPIIGFAWSTFMYSQQSVIPEYYNLDEKLDNEIKLIVEELKLDKDFDVGEDGIEQISLAVIDLSENTPVFFGYNPGNFIYPASVYKMYVAANVLSQISEKGQSSSGGNLNLSSSHIIKEHNAVDKTREIGWDPRPLLTGGDTVTINYLLDLMITRSDNSAANCLIDIAGRSNINTMMKKYDWTGSEVTRKFLKRKLEDPGYSDVPSTMTCALHSADFLYRIYTNQLINEWVSRQMMTFLGRQLDKSKLAPGLPSEAMFYHKTGWFSYWTNDVGIVLNGKTKYIIACFLPLEEKTALPIMKTLSEKIYSLMNKKESK